MAGVIDSHFHVDTTLVSLSGLRASMEAAGIERIALIPNLCPPLSLPPGGSVGPAVLRALIHRRAGFFHSAGLAVYRNTVKKDGTVDLLGRRYEVKVQPRNDEVLEAVGAHPESFWGWVFVNPAGPVDVVSEMERCLAVPGMIGVKAHPFWHDYPVKLLLDVAAFCQEGGWPLLIHLGVGSHGDFRLLPESFRRLKVIYAHAGIPYSFEVCDYARGRENVFVDFASLEYVDSRTAREALRRAGPDKCIFGSDGPYFRSAGDRFNYQPHLKMMESLRLADADWEKVMGANFRALLR